MRLYVGVGTKFKLNGVLYEVVEEIEMNNYLAKNLEFQSHKKKYTLSELHGYLEEGVLEFQHDPIKVKREYDFSDFSMLSLEKREEAKYRYFVIKPLLSVTNEALRPYVLERKRDLQAQGYKVSVRSIYRWLKAYLESEGDVRSLVNNKHQSGPKENLLHGEVEWIIEETIRKLYDRRELSNPKKVYYEVVNQINKRNQENDLDEGLKYPSLATIRRRIKSSSSYGRDKLRLGDEVSRKKYSSVQNQQRPKFPLQRVEMDHTKADVILVDGNNLPLGRPTLTTALDKFTGYPLGIYVGFEPPSYTAVMNCLIHAFSPKLYLKERYPSVKNDWLAYGLPNSLVVDRGKEFKSKHLSEACLQLGIELEHNPPRSPWYKGSVERFFRTLNEGIIHQSAGTTFSNVIKKGDYNSEKHAVLKLENFLEMLHIHIVDVYAQEARGQRLSPARMWLKAVENGFVPPIPSTKLNWKIALMKIGQSTIQNTGIRKDHLYYQSKGLKDLKFRLGLKGKGDKVKYKFDPSDISKIYVYDELEMKYIEVLCTDEEYSANLNEYAHRIFVEDAREENKKHVNISAIAEAKARTEKILQEAVLLKKERKQFARMSGTGSDKLLDSTKVNALDGKDLIEKIQKKEEVDITEYSDIKDLDFDEDWGIVYDD